MAHLLRALTEKPEPGVDLPSDIFSYEIFVDFPEIFQLSQLQGRSGPLYLFLELRVITK